MDLRDYLSLARRQWWLIALSAILSVGAAILITANMTPKYVATIKLFVSSGRTENATALYEGATFTQERAKSYADLMRSRRLALAVIHDLRLTVGPDELLSRVEAQVVPETVMIKATVSDSSPQRAQRVADAMGNELSVLVDTLERSSKTGPAPVKVTMVDAADLPATPVSPRPLRAVLSALGTGLLLGFGFTVVRERLDRSVKSGDRLTELTGTPSLGVVGHDHRAGKYPLVVQIAPHAARSEAFRQIRTSLQFIDAQAATKRIIVTSCGAGEGKSTVVSNLAVTFAQAGQRVIVVDADLRGPQLFDHFGIDGSAGLTDVLIQRATLDDVLQPWEDLPLQVLASGPVPPNPSELLGSAQMAALLDQLGARADIVLFDAPPLLPVTDAVVLARRCDGAVLVARHGATRGEHVRRVTALMADVDVRLIGTVLNMAPPSGSGGYLKPGRPGPTTGSLIPEPTAGS